MIIMDKNKIVSALITKKNSIYNLRVKVGTRKFQLAGIGAKNLKVRPTRLPKYPHMELVGFLDWSKWNEFTKEEQELVKAFYGSLPK